MKPMEGLSHREAEVLELVGRRLSNPQIAERLSMSVRTVKRHVASLIRKFGVADRRAVATYPAETGGPARGVRNIQTRHNLPGARSSFIGRPAERVSSSTSRVGQTGSSKQEV